MRPGRLDRILYVGPPNRQGRVDILKIRTQKMAIGPDVDLEELSDMVIIFFISGEPMKSLINGSLRRMAALAQSLQLYAKTQP